MRKRAWGPARHAVSTHSDEGNIALGAGTPHQALRRSTVLWANGPMTQWRSDNGIGEGRRMVLVPVPVLVLRMALVLVLV